MKQLRRTRIIMLGISSVACLGLSVGLLSARGAPAGGQAKEAEAKNQYIGQAKCKGCHSTAETGDQHAQWAKSDHAKAFEVLASEEAKKIAAEKGIADPQKEAACVKCHVTAHGEAPEKIKKGFEFADGVQCETCHGPGGQHMKARFAAAAEAGAGGGYVKLPEGELIAAPKEATCRGCHNKESPTFKAFCFNKFHSEVSHINPKKPRTEAELAAIHDCGCGDACACADRCVEGCGVPAKTKK